MFMEHQKFRNYMAEQGYELRPDEAAQVLEITKNFCKFVGRLDDEEFLSLFDEDSLTIEEMRGRLGFGDKQIEDFRKLLIAARAQN